MQNPPTTSQRYCPKCGTVININERFCAGCGNPQAPLQHQPQQPYLPQPPVMRTGKTVSETKCTCRACGKVWFYGKQESVQNASNAMANVGKGMMCCGGCVPALLIPDKKVTNLKKCPNCGSTAVLTEKVTHQV